MLTWGLPSDLVAWGALGLGILVALIPRSFIGGFKRCLGDRLIWLLALGASGLSLGYYYFYLGGAPRIIDATAYLHEAQAFAEGSVGLHAPEPSASFRGRFLIHTAGDSSLLAGIFPPGYPLVLALGVLIAHPQYVGPLIGGAIVLATYHLSLSLSNKKDTALLAALFSLLSAALRYHSAETMSHGWSTLLSLISVVSVIRLTGSPKSAKWALLLGASLGLLVATRQLTGVVFCFSSALVLVVSKQTFSTFSKSARLLALIGAALAPGILLLLTHHYLITGEALFSPQLRYYSLADGPANCFGLGLGRGCNYEHAGVVAEQGGQGLTAYWALKNTLHRLHWHSLDIANFEPLIVLALIFSYQNLRNRQYWPLFAPLLAIPTAYSLFYFNGSYPGGGARLFSELIPLWHVLLAAALNNLPWARWAIVSSLAGFAVHASFSHQLLKQRNFGPPGRALEQIPSLLKEKNAGETPALILFSTAHHFNLAWRDPSPYFVARRTHDDREYLLAKKWNARAWAFKSGLDKYALEEVIFPPRSTTSPYQFESESDYPPLHTKDLWTHPDYVPPNCISRGRALALHIQGSSPQLTLETGPVPQGFYHVTLHVLLENGKCAQRSLGDKMMPKNILLSGKVLHGISHIDRLVLRPVPGL